MSNKKLKFTSIAQHNKKGALLGRVHKYDNIKKRNPVSITNVDKIYQQYLKKYDPSKIMILAMMGDGIKTLKRMGSDDKSIRFALDDYYLSYGTDVKKKFSRAYSLEITIAE